MDCPVCGGMTRVIDSVSDCESVYRRRRCLKCDYRFFTTETESDNKDFNRLKKEAWEKYKSH